METLEELIKQCIQYFELHGYSVARVNTYKFLWLKKLKPYMVKQSIPYYDASVGEKFIRSIVTGDIISRYEDDIIRSILFLNEFQEKGTISKYHYKPLERELSGPVGLAMEKFLLHLGSLRRTKKTISEYRLSLYKLFIYLESKQIQSLEEIKEIQIMTFLTTSTNNKIFVISSIRFFLRYMYEEHLLATHLSLSLQHFKYSRGEKLPSVYSENEVLQIEASIQRSDATGKRDYAMMLLATRLGLRASDIACLSFSNLDWEQSIITLSQFKTGKEIKLPLLAAVGEALIDYLKYGRKHCESDKVFLFTRTPFSPMTNSSVSLAFGRIIEASRVDVNGRRHGAHAMRHSLACRFLENKESMPVISEALGHRSTESTMSYLRIDIESLSQCVLNVPPFLIISMNKKEGFFMNKLNYQSIYAPYFKQFIAIKNGLGYTSLRAQWVFLELDNFFLNKDVREIGITKQQIEQWRATRINDAQSTIYDKYSILAQFCKYMCGIGYDCFIPKLPRKISGFTPHIFTNKQMMDIFQACDHFELYDRHVNTTLFIMPAVIRLLYGTGLRINEALSLKNNDIDFDKKCLYVRKSKNGDERISPLSETLVIVLKQYLHYRDRMPLPRIKDEENFFFVSPIGTRCLQGVVYDWFRNALTASGIPHQGDHKGPRLHDLRHTFAVHSLIKMSKSGLDLYYSLPLLSTCLGHRSLKSTDRYVRLTAEIYQDLLKDENEISGHIFPKTKTSINNGNN